MSTVEATESPLAYRETETTDFFTPDIPRAAMSAMTAGVGALGLGFFLALFQENGPTAFAFGYLLNACFCLSLVLGALFFVIFHHLTRAGWSVVIRRVMEIVAVGVVPMAFVFVPIVLRVALGSSVLFPWNAEEVDALTAYKAPYLNWWFFTLRAAFYFLVWIYLVRLFLRTSLEQDVTGDKYLTLKMQRYAAISIYLLAPTVTFAAIDWMMSLDPHWFSTIFGVYYFAGSCVGFLSLLGIAVVVLRGRGYLQGVTVEHLHDIGKLLFGFNCFWAYIAFSQYFLIWYANIPEETEYFLHRQQEPWGTLSMILIVGHFVIPFVGFMPRDAKRNPAALVLWCVWLLVMHYLDLCWLIMPEATASAPLSYGMLLLQVLGIGTLCAGASIWAANRKAMVPTKDPRLAESLAFENI